MRLAAFAGAQQRTFVSFIGQTEWPTIGLILICYIAWGFALWLAVSFNLLLGCALGAVFTALHGSLQHEVLHGHPTRSAALNEAMVFLPLGVFFPYRRFRALHLRHHNNERLTDPYDDPESWFITESDYDRLGAPARLILQFNRTLAGRLTIGPALSIIGFWRHDLRLAAGGEPGLPGALVRWAMGLALVLGGVWVLAGVSPLVYIAGVAYPGLSLLMLRTYAEHRPAEVVAERSVIVEAGPVFSLLYLNNNLHHLHHKHPQMAWYRLPKVFRADRENLLTENGHYLYRGYGHLIAEHLFRPLHTIVHPFLRRQNTP